MRAPQPGAGGSHSHRLPGQGAPCLLGAASFLGPSPGAVPSTGDQTPRAGQSCVHLRLLLALPLLPPDCRCLKAENRLRHGLTTRPQQKACLPAVPSPVPGTAQPGSCSEGQEQGVCQVHATLPPISVFYDDPRHESPRVAAGQGWPRGPALKGPTAARAWEKLRLLPSASEQSCPGLHRRPVLP